MAVARKKAVKRSVKKATPKKVAPKANGNGQAKAEATPKQVTEDRIEATPKVTVNGTVFDFIEKHMAEHDGKGPNWLTLQQGLVGVRKPAQIIAEARADARLVCTDVPCGVALATAATRKEATKTYRQCKPGDAVKAFKFRGEKETTLPREQVIKAVVEASHCLPWTPGNQICQAKQEGNSFGFRLTETDKVLTKV